MSQDIGNMHDLCAFASEFVSMCVCADILYGEACDGDNASRELTHIVDVDRDEQVRQMEQRTVKTRLTLCRLKVRTLAADDAVGMTGKHVCAESVSALALCVSRVERAWLFKLLGLDVGARARRWAVVGATHCLEVCRPANQTA